MIEWFLGSLEPKMETQPVRVHYYGTYDPGQPEEHLQVQLFGAKRPYEQGWVYRLDGEVVVGREQDMEPKIYHYDDILVYMVQGQIVSASEEVFVDTTGEHPYTWDDLEYVITNYEMEDDYAEDVEPITDEECMYAAIDYEEDEEEDWAGSDDEDSD